MKGRNDSGSESAFRKPVWHLSVLTSNQAEEAVLELLLTIFDQTAAIYFDCETNLSTCSIYSVEKPDRASMTTLKSGLESLKTYGLEILPGRISLRRLPYKSWAESWKRHFKPIHLAGKILITPSWSRLKSRKGESVIVLDPGLSFGTGQHPTTGFCLRELTKGLQGGGDRSLLDLGTGSGILAITAAKLGYKPIAAIDIDPESVRVAKANATKNKVIDEITVLKADLKQLSKVSRQKYSVICANLMADLLIECRKIILARLAPGGKLIVAGILRREFEEVERALNDENLKLMASRCEKEWRSATFVSTAFRSI